MFIVLCLLSTTLGFILLAIALKRALIIAKKQETLLDLQIEFYERELNKNDIKE